MLIVDPNTKCQSKIGSQQGLGQRSLVDITMYKLLCEPSVPICECVTAGTLIVHMNRLTGRGFVLPLCCCPGASKDVACCQKSWHQAGSFARRVFRCVCK